MASERLVAVQARFENDLRQADVRGHAEPLVDRAPLREKASVLAGVRQQGVSARRVVQHRPRGALQEERDLFPPFTQLARELLAVEDVGERGVGPHGVARPVAFRGKGREEPPVNGAAIRDRAVGQGEHVLPERVARPEGLHRGEVVAPACRGDIGRCVRRLGARSCGRLRARPLVTDVRRGQRNRGGQRDERQDGVRSRSSAVRMMCLCIAH